jgi:hypothetical protein
VFLVSSALVEARQIAEQVKNKLKTKLTIEGTTLSMNELSESIQQSWLQIQKEQLKLEKQKQQYQINQQKLPLKDISEHKSQNQSEITNNNIDPILSKRMSTIEESKSPSSVPSTSLNSSSSSTTIVSIPTVDQQILDKLKTIENLEKQTLNIVTNNSKKKTETNIFSKSESSSNNQYFDTFMKQPTQQSSQRISTPHIESDETRLMNEQRRILQDEKIKISQLKYQIENEKKQWENELNLKKKSQQYDQSTQQQLNKLISNPILFSQFSSPQNEFILQKLNRTEKKLKQFQKQIETKNQMKTYVQMI